MEELTLDIQHLSVGYKSKQPLLGGIDLKVRAGEIIALVGENGKGKTTFLKTLCGILLPVEGTILIEGTALHRLPATELAAAVSVVLTEKPSIGNIRVKNLISFGRYPFTNWLGIQKEKDREKVAEAIELCKIEELLDKVFYELSDGERQKVMIARAIAQDSRIIILDEPTAHLDITNRLAIMQLLAKLAQKKGMTVIYSTHEIELALKNSGRIWLISNGKVYDQSPKALLQSDLLTRAFSVPEGYFDALKL